MGRPDNVLLGSTTGSASAGSSRPHDGNDFSQVKLCDVGLSRYLPSPPRSQTTPPLPNPLRLGLDTASKGRVQCSSGSKNSSMITEGTVDNTHAGTMTAGVGTPMFMAPELILVEYCVTV